MENMLSHKTGRKKEDGQKFRGMAFVFPRNPEV